LHALVEEHRRETGSVFAAELLAHWDHEVGQFWHVVPKEMVPRLQHPLSDTPSAMRA
jgi:glutamate synthase (NADPH/NADH) large chain